MAIKMLKTAELFTIYNLLLVQTIYSAVPWYEEKLSHQLKELTETEFTYLATNLSDMELFESLLDPLLIPRLPGTPNHTIVKEFIKDHLGGLGWTLENDEFEDLTPFGNRTFENIVATLNTNVSRRLVLACHYDSKYFSGDPEFLGAIDSGVPCAMLLHLAAVLDSELQAHKTNHSKNVTLQFIFFDGEEAFRFWTATDSLYGSRHLAKIWGNESYPLENQENTNTLNRMDLLMLLDLLGAQEPKIPNYIPNTSTLFSELYHLEHALRRFGYWSGPITSPSYFQIKTHGNISDDQIPFLERDVRVVHIIPSPMPSSWHSVRDNKENLDWNTIDNLCRVVRLFVAKYIHISM